MTHSAVAARGMIALGIGFLVLALAIRPAISSRQSRSADSAAIVVAVLMVISGVVVAVREARRGAADDSVFSEPEHDVPSN